MAVFACIIAAVALHTFFATSLHTVATVILIESQPLDVIDIERVLAHSNGSGDDDYYTTQCDILGSCSLAAEIIEQQNINALGLVVVPANWTAARGIHSKLLDAYMNDWLEIEPQEESRLVKFRYTSSDPRLRA